MYTVHDDVGGNTPNQNMTNSRIKLLITYMYLVSALSIQYCITMRLEEIRQLKSLKSK